PEGLPRGAVPAVPEPHAGQPAMGAKEWDGPGAVGARAWRADPHAAVRVDPGAEPVRQAVRSRGGRAGRDAAARQPRAERRAPGALQLPAGGDADHAEEGVSVRPRLQGAGEGRYDRAEEGRK